MLPFRWIEALATHQFNLYDLGYFHGKVFLRMPPLHNCSHAFYRRYIVDTHETDDPRVRGRLHRTRGAFTESILNGRKMHRFPCNTATPGLHLVAGVISHQVWRWFGNRSKYIRESGFLQKTAMYNIWWVGGIVRGTPHRFLVCRPQVFTMGTAMISQKPLYIMNEWPISKGKGVNHNYTEEYFVEPDCTLQLCNVRCYSPGVAVINLKSLIFATIGLLSVVPPNLRGHH